MLIPCDIRLIATITDIQQMYAIYMHRDADETVQYIGITPLADLFSLTDARCNSMWVDTFAQPLTTVEIDVIALTNSEREAFAEQRRQIAIHQPPMNIKGYYVAPNRQNIICNETGEIFRTTRECALAHGLSQSALTNHLNGKIGHRTVKGRTYNRTLKDHDQ